MNANNFYIWGKDAYLVEEKVNETIRQIIQSRGEEAEIIYLDADEISPQQLAQTLEFSPLFSSLRVILIKSPFWLNKKIRKNSKLEEIAKAWHNYLQSSGTDQYVILTAADYSPANMIVKTFAKRIEVIQCKSLEPVQLRKWIAEQFESRNFKANTGAIALLASTGQDLHYLKNLIDKTCLIVGNKTVTEADLADDLRKIENTTVFKITDEIFKRNAKMAITYLHKYIEQEQSPIVALFMIVKQFTQFGKVKYFKNQGYTSKEIADKTKMQGFQVKNMERYLNNYTNEDLRKVFACCLEADISIKRTSKDQLLVMETLIFELCNISISS